MRKCLIFLLCLCLFTVAVSAETLEGDPDNWGDWYVDPEDVVIGEVVSVGVGQTGNFVFDTPDVESEPLEVEASDEEPETSVVLSSDSGPSDLDAGISTLSLNPISPTATSGLKSALLGILGNYDAIIVEYSNGNYTSREVTPDYVWICSFCLLSLVIYCLFKMLGGWLIRKQ